MAATGKFEGLKAQSKWPGIGAVDKITAFKPQTIIWKQFQLRFPLRLLFLATTKFGGFFLRKN